MRQLRTSRGKLIDMGALAQKHEETRAVGNVPMNARGDRLDKDGNVVATVQSVSRVQHDTQQPKEAIPLSNPVAPSNKKSKAKKEPEPVIMSSEIKVREDGSRYEEIEYDDGTIDTKELGGDE